MSERVYHMIERVVELGPGAARPHLIRRRQRLEN